MSIGSFLTHSSQVYVSTCVPNMPILYTDSHANIKYNLYLFKMYQLTDDCIRLYQLTDDCIRLYQLTDDCIRLSVSLYLYK